MMHDDPTPAAILAFLRQAPLFTALSDAEIGELVAIMEVRRYRRGHAIVVEGEKGDAWFVIQDGEVEVVKATPSGPKALAILGHHACFGEMAILDGSPRSASVRSSSEVTLLRVPLDAFQAMLDNDRVAAFRIVHQIALVLVGRQRATTTRLGELVSADDPHRYWEGGDQTPVGADRVEGRV